MSEDFNKDKILKIAFEELERAVMALDSNLRPAKRVYAEYSSPLNVSVRQKDITVSELLGLTNSMGLIAGESFDLIEYGLINGGKSLLTYSLSGISQFQIIIDLANPASFSILKRPAQFDMLKEDGFRLLTEAGDKILIQGLVP